jgi:uncharacterized protein (TIGR02453 family)
MQQQKPVYQAQRTAFLDLVGDTISGLTRFEEGVQGLEPKDCVFRINRDIRFSKDKTLYKTHFGAYMAEGGRKSMLPGYYLHIEPGNKSMLAAGVYRPPSDLLAKVRQEIDYNPKEFLKIVEKKTWKEQFGTLEGERLTRAPKGYPMDHPQISYLQLKSFMAIKRFKDTEVTEPNFPKTILQTYKRMSPLVHFLQTAIS